jgi:hypothetical protein
MIARIQQKLQSRSVLFVSKIDTQLPMILLGWAIIAGSLGCLRFAFPVTPHANGLHVISSFLPYDFVVAAPVVTLLLALRWFPKNGLIAQPEMRFAQYGRWRTLDCLSARSHPLFGATGIMASLLVGMLINVPVRTAEFMVAIPSIGGHAPGWLQMLFTATLADVAVLTSLYAVTFVMALRHVPLFPRFLVFVWALDLAAQLWIAQAVVTAEGLPPEVAAALEGLLEGNLKKALISISLWLPYLIVSERVNVTYRSRVRVR